MVKHAKLFSGRRQRFFDHKLFYNNYRFVISVVATGLRVQKR